MKKYIIIASLAVGALAYGQINIQSNPNPTINQENPFLDASSYNNFKNNVGKGLYFPTTDLTTWEFKTDRVNPGKFKNYFDGMIVYNSASGQTIEDATKGGKQVKVEPGFYYFKNPGATFPTGSVASGEWVRLNDSFTSNQEWKYNPTNQHIELVRSGKGTFKNKVFYNKDGFFQNYTNNEWTFWDWQSNSYITRNIPEDYRFNYSQRSSKEIEDVLGVNYKILSATRLLVNEDSGVKYGMEADQTVLQIEKENTANYGHMAALLSRNSHFGRGNVDNLLGGVSTTELRESATANRAVGVQGDVILSNTSHAKNIRGGTFLATISGNSYASDIVGAASSVSDNARDANGTIEAFTGFRAYLQFLSKGASAIPYASGLEIKPVAYTNNATQITDLRGLYYNPDWGKANTTSVENEYGIYLGDVSKGKTLNYAIYTGLGDIRFGQFKEENAPAERLLAVDADGKLVIGGSSATFTSLWANDTANNLIKLKNLADGTTARTDEGEDRNSVTISDEGIFTAKGYRGYNGGSVFPDYVFQKYYTGTSTIKAEYDFKGLNQIEDFVKTNGHLPGYLSAKEVKEQGYIDIIDTQLTNVEKIEELYLHTIEQEKKIEQQSKEIVELKKLVQQLLNK